MGITSGIGGQMSQSNAGSDSLCFLLIPSIFSIHDVTQKTKSGKEHHHVSYICTV